MHFPGKSLFSGMENIASINHLPVKYTTFMVKIILIIFRQGYLGPVEQKSEVKYY